MELQFCLLVPLLYRLGCWCSPYRATLVAAGAFAVFFPLALLFAIVWAVNDEAEGRQIALKQNRYTFAPHVYLFFVGVFLQRARAGRPVARRERLVMAWGIPALAFLCAEVRCSSTWWGA